MSFSVVTALGLAAMALSVLSLLPQVVRTWRTRSAGDISAHWLVAALAGMALWIAYGVMVDAPAVIWANVAAFAQAGFILAIKLRTDRPRLPS